MVFAQSDPGMDPKAVQQLMLQGRLDLIESKFRDLRSARGNELGKAIQDPIYRAPDSASIFYPEVDKIWNACLDNLMIWERNCPEIFPAIPATALGCCFAMQKGDPSVLPKLRDVAEMLLAQQYHPRNVSIANGTIPGVFGVAHVAQQALCSQSGAIQRNAAFMCRESPGYCPVYQKGAYAGQAFAVADQLPEELYFNGSLAALQSGSVALMLALHLQTNDSVYLEAARSCGNWCMAENPFYNHRPTAHLILALAALYEYTGEKKWKDRILYLLKVSVLPGILLDADQNGVADGTSTLFAGLVPYANYRVECGMLRMPPPGTPPYVHGRLRMRLPPYITGAIWQSLLHFLELQAK